MPPAARRPNPNAPALAHLGWALRQRRLQAALERRQVADAVRYSEEVVKRVELGTYHANIKHYISRWKAVYGLDDELQALWSKVLAEQTARDPLADLAEADLETAALLVPGELVALVDGLRLPEMERRRLLHLMATTLGAAGSLSVFDDSWDRLAFALQRPSGADATAVAALAARTANFHEIANHLPGRMLIKGMRAHVQTMASLLEGHLAPAVRRELLATVGEAMLHTGWVANEAGDQSGAVRLYGLALDAARTIGDRELFASVLIYMSYDKDPGTAVRLLEAARAQATRAAGPATTAWLTARQAEELARAGERREALHTLDTARAAFQDAAPAEERSWTWFLNDTRFRSFELRTLILLNEHDAARGVAAGAVADLPHRIDRNAQSLLLIDVASAHLALGDLDEACGFAARSLEHARRVEGSLALSRLAESGPR